jgi:hypothetical protein
MPASPVARPDAIRRHNLALVLEHVHRDGPVTRAELTQRLAVSRSTVGALVADLIELGLVDEEVPSGGSGVGRPSHVVGPHPAGPYVVAVDIDVTQVVTAAVGIGGIVLAREVVTTGADACAPDTVAGIIVDAVDRIRISVFVSCSFMAAVAGIAIGSNVASVAPNSYNGNILLLAVGAAVIGGTSLFGGKGRLIDALIGGAVVEVIQHGMADLVSGPNGPAVQYIVTGLVLLLAAAVDALSRRRAGSTGLA